jgi:hypothetical protein
MAQDEALFTGIQDHHIARADSPKSSLSESGVSTSCWMSRPEAAPRIPSL